MIKKVRGKVYDYNGVTIYQVVATDDFCINGTNIKKGDMGGFVDNSTKINGMVWIDPKSVVIESDLSNCIICNSTISGSSVTDSRVHDSTVSDCRVTNDSICSRTNLKRSVIRESKVAAARVKDCRVIRSEVRNTNLLVPLRIYDGLVINDYSIIAFPNPVCKGAHNMATAYLAKDGVLISIGHTTYTPAAFVDKANRTVVRRRTNKVREEFRLALMMIAGRFDRQDIYDLAEQIKFLDA